MRALFLAALLFAAPAVHAADCAGSDLNTDQRRLLGQNENLCQTYGGKAVLVVNVASKCGYTPQYEGLEKIYQTYKDRGLVVLGFPSGDFMGQEFGEEEEIAKFCKVNYGVTFPLYGKSSVKGKDANPLFKTLAAKSEAPGWNFNKYLVGRDGKLVEHYGSKVKPDNADLVKAIEAALGAPVP